MKPGKTAIIYARVSTVRQAEDELPIDSQIEQCHKKAKELSATVIHVYRDDGKSGRYDTRPAFQRAINYCELSSPDYFITWSSSRFARNIEDAIVYKRKLGKAGVNLIYVSMDVDTETIGGFALDTVMSLFDDIYSRQLAADTVRGMMKNARDGYFNGGSLPFGFESYPAPDNNKRKKLRANPTESPIVVEIFDLKINGHGLRSIAAHLNDRNKLNRGRRWNKSTVSSVLRSYAVIGQTSFNKKNKRTGRENPSTEWINIQSHDPIIAIEKWNTVQDLMRACSFGNSATSHNSTRFFTGLLFCDKCGSSMQIESGSGRSQKYYYYNCRAHQRTGGCESRRIRADIFDEWMVDQIACEVFTRENLTDVFKQLQAVGSEWAGKQRAKKKELMARHAAVESKNRKLYEVLELMGAEGLNLADLAPRLRRNNAELGEIESELISLESEQAPELPIAEHDIDKLAMAMVDIIKTSDNPKKIRQFFGSFIKGIYITDRDARISYLPEALLRQQRFPVSPGWLPRADVLGTRSLTISLPDQFVRRAA